MQRQTTGMPYLLKDKQCIQQITRPRTQAGVQHLPNQLQNFTFLYVNLWGQYQMALYCAPNKVAYYHLSLRIAYISEVLLVWRASIKQVNNI